MQPYVQPRVQPRVQPHAHRPHSWDGADGVSTDGVMGFTYRQQIILVTKRDELAIGRPARPVDAVVRHGRLPIGLKGGLLVFGQMRCRVFRAMLPCIPPTGLGSVAIDQDREILALALALAHASHLA